MDKKELLKFCRYYKGEDDCHFKEQNKSMLWFYERAWVYEMSNDSKDLYIYIEEYIRHGLRTFEMFNNIPLTLKALLFNRFARTFQSMAEAVEPFKTFYIEYYTKKGE